MKRMAILVITAFMACLGSIEAAEFKLQVKHKHTLGSCQGELVFGEKEVTFTASKKEHVRTWSYPDIQQLGLLGGQKLAIVTYEDRTMAFGKDRIFNFEVTQGKVDEPLFAFLEKHLTRPLASDFIPATVQSKYTIPVKHLRGWGGTQGMLEVADVYLVYRTAAKSDSRIWRYGDIDSIGSTGPYQLRLTSLERVNGEIGAQRNFVFDLKEKLNAEAYEFIWWKINGPKISGSK
jgi:hypothetical protein